MKTKDHKKYLYWKNRYDKLGAIGSHVTLKDKSWAEMSYEEKAQVYRTLVLVVTGKIVGKDITNEIM